MKKTSLFAFVAILNRSLNCSLNCSLNLKARLFKAYKQRPAKKTFPKKSSTSLFKIYFAAAFVACWPLCLFAQNQDIIEKNLADKTPKSQEDIAKKDAEDSDKSRLLNSKNNIFANDDLLTKSLLGNDKIKSLMFDEREIGEINRAIDSFKNNQTFSITNIDGKNNNAEKKKELTKENEKSYIYLASIIYYSSKEWAIWINNNKITSDDNKIGKELFVKEAYADRVKILWSLSASKWRILSNENAEKNPPKLNANNIVEIEFALKPNQTFILKSNQVVEGRAVSSVIKAKESQNNSSANTK